MKKALLIGINYKGTSYELKGCINDVNNMKEFLLTQGYNEENIEILSDDTSFKPTRINILNKILDLVLSDCNNLFFHYSGHGTYIADTDGSELDGRDECIVPLDYMRSGVIIDDEIRGLLQALDKKKKMFMILDCCNSGTGTDLCFNMYERGGRYEMMRCKKHSKTRGQVVMLSGCKDDQFSNDCFIDGTYQGALTNTFLKVIKSDKYISYIQLMKNIHSILRSEKLDQIPCLSSGKRLNIRSTVTF